MCFKGEFVFYPDTRILTLRDSLNAGSTESNNFKIRFNSLSLFRQHEFGFVSFKCSLETVKKQDEVVEKPGLLLYHRHTDGCYRCLSVTLCHSSIR